MPDGERLDEFIIDIEKVGLVDQLKERIENVYEVILTKGLQVQDEGNQKQWIGLSGNQHARKKAKNYMKALCNPEETMTVPYPAALHDQLTSTPVHNRLENQSKSAIIFPRDHNEAVIHGTSMAVTLAVSALEDLIRKYKDVSTSFTDTGDVTFTMAPNTSVGSERLNRELEMAMSSRDDLEVDQNNTMNDAVKRVMLTFLKDEDESHSDPEDEQPDEDATKYITIDKLDDAIGFDKTALDATVIDADVTATDADVTVINADRTVLKGEDPDLSLIEYKAPKQAVHNPDGSVEMLLETPVKTPLPRLHEDSLDNTRRRPGPNYCSTPATSAYTLPGVLSRHAQSTTLRPVASPSDSSHSKQTKDGFVSIHRKAEVVPCLDREPEVADPTREYLEVYHNKSMSDDMKKTMLNYLTENREAGVRTAYVPNRDIPQTVALPSDRKSGNEPDIDKERLEFYYTNGTHMGFTRADVDEVVACYGTLISTSDLIQALKTNREGKEETSQATRKSRKMSGPRPVTPTDTAMADSLQKLSSGKDEDDRLHSLESSSQKTGTDEADCKLVDESELDGAYQPVRHRKKKSRWDGDRSRSPLGKQRHRSGEGPSSWNDDYGASVAPSRAPAAPLQQLSNIPQPRAGALRYIVIDGSNIAMAHGNRKEFSCKGIKIAVDYFLKRGHREITAFVPQFRQRAFNYGKNPTKDQQILTALQESEHLVFTPSRKVEGRHQVCYDDKFIVQLAAETDGVIVSNDNYRDLMIEKPGWRHIIVNRLLMYSFVGDILMVPDDPHGRHGPTLDQLLSKEYRALPGVGQAVPGYASERELLAQQNKRQTVSNMQTNVGGNRFPNPAQSWGGPQAYPRPTIGYPRLAQTNSVPPNPYAVPSRYNQSHYTTYNRMPSTGPVPNYQANNFDCTDGGSSSNPNKQQRDPATTRDLCRQLLEVFPDSSEQIQRILMNHPYDSNIEKLSSYMLDM